jgi:hypothetical protein
VTFFASLVWSVDSCTVLYIEFYEELVSFYELILKVIRGKEACKAIG